MMALRILRTIKPGIRAIVTSDAGAEPPPPDGLGRHSRVVAAADSVALQRALEALLGEAGN